MYGLMLLINMFARHNSGVSITKSYSHEYISTLPRCNLQIYENNRPGVSIISEIRLQVFLWLVYNLVICSIDIGLVRKLLSLYERVGERTAVGYRLFRKLPPKCHTITITCLRASKTK